MKSILTIIMLIGAGLLIPGLITRTRAILSGRRGASFFQHMRNLNAMLHKGVVRGHTSTLISLAAPAVYLSGALTALLLVPLAGMPPAIGFGGDFVMFAYLMGLGRLALILAALDTGSSFEGMGASREALYGAMIEPAVFIVAGTLALASGMTSFAAMFNALSSGGHSAEMTIVLILLVYVMVKVISVECGRMPVDDPRTHLELTMIHEVMILDYSGIDLATITAGTWIKTAALSAIAGNILQTATGGGWILALVYTVLMGVVIGFIESFVARNKMSRNTTYIFSIVAIAFVLFVIAFMLRFNISIV